MKQKVKIIIPIYQKKLSENDFISFDQCYKVHCQYQIIIIKPEGLDLSFLHNKYPGIGEESFSADYFNGIDGYNQLMLSPDFYQRFLDTEYILIHQLDAFVFKDTLDEWCNKGYDYVGAPWILRPVYQKFPINICCIIKGIYCDLFSLPNRQKIYFQVGNGGLSLRRTKTFFFIAKNDRVNIEYYLSMKNKAHCYNEDVYWALEANKFYLTFSIPGYREALKFAFDKYPKLCYRMNNQTLPYGCHSWTKKKMYKFWEPILKSIINNN